MSREVVNQLTPSSPLINSSPSSEALVVSSMSSAMSRTCKSGTMRSCYRVERPHGTATPPSRGLQVHRRLLRLGHRRADNVHEGRDAAEGDRVGLELEANYLMSN